MLLIMTKIIIGIIMSLTGFITANNILGSRLPKIKKRNAFLCIIIVSIPTIVLYKTDYNLILTMLVYILMAISFKYLFDIEIVSSILLCGFVMLLTAFADIIIATIETKIFTYYQVRNNALLNITNNVLVFVICIIITKDKKIKNILKKFIEKIENNSKIKSVFFTVMIVLVMMLLYHNITSIFEINTPYIITFASMVIFFILYYIFINERNNYDKLKNEYNIIFSYIQTFEEWIDNEQLYRHELKNNLSIIRNLTNKQEINKKIDKMLNMSIIVDQECIEVLKDLPSGGLKGLLYYKMALAKNEKVKFYIDISPKIKNKLNKLNKNLIENICIILGIYIDNSIEAAKNTEKKIVTLEIYEANREINFVISNSYNTIVSVDKMSEKGFSTKGKNRGKGLYFVEKIIRNSKQLESKKTYLNDYFIQKLIVKNNEK